MSKLRKIFTTSILLIILTILTRVLGFFREVIIAYNFGTSSIVDHYVSSQIIGELIGNVILVGAFSTYIVLIANKSGREMVKKTLFVALFLTLPLSLITFFSPDFIANLVAKGANAKEVEQIAAYIRILSPTIVFLTCTAVLNGYLQFLERHLQPVISIIMMNIAFILSLVFLQVVNDKYILPIAYLISIIVYLSYSLFAYLYFKNKMKINENITSESKSYKSVFIGIIPIVVSMSILKLTLITDRVFGSWLEEGQLASFNYAFKLINLPVAIIATSLVNIMFVNYSKSNSQKQLGKDYTDLLFKISIFVTIFAFIYARDIVQIVYGYGEFGSEEVKNTSLILKYYSLTIPLQFIFMLFMKIGYAALNNKVILTISGIGIMINVLLNIILINDLKIYSIILSTFVSLTIQCLIYYNKLVKKSNKKNIVIEQMKNFSLAIVLYLSLSILNSYLSGNALFLLISLVCYTAIFVITQKILKLNLLRKVSDLSGK